ncbi:MAG: radical SAM protein [Planctomycetota bacterium]
MTMVISKPDTHRKLQILSEDARYDLACACGSSKDQHRTQGRDGKWIYPVTLPNGGQSILFKTLYSNMCANDCSYCPLRAENDIRRCSLTPEQTAEVFLDYYRRKKVFGLFLSSGVIRTPDNTMQHLSDAAEILRKKRGFKGFIHLKIIPGCSNAAIEKAVSLASAVSLNIETPGENNLRKLSAKKDYIRDIIKPLKLISALTAKGSRYERVRKSTQFIVGAAGETDREIVKYTAALYKRLAMNRVYFSAYQKGLGRGALEVEKMPPKGTKDSFTREHRLYQVDFLLRRYGFNETEILFDDQGRLSLQLDPKELWAQNHPEFFPVCVNKADKYRLLRVPGLGPITVEKILKIRKTSRICGWNTFGRFNSRLEKTAKYVTF